MNYNTQTVEKKVLKNIRQLLSSSHIDKKSLKEQINKDINDPSKMEPYMNGMIHYLHWSEWSGISPVNFYIENNNLYQFMLDHASDLPKDVVLKAVKNMGLKNQISDSFLINDTTEVYSFNIISEEYPITFFMVVEDSEEMAFVCKMHDKNNYHFCGLKLLVDEQFSEQEGFKLLNGFVAYCVAFPDKIVDTPPKHVKKTLKLPKINTSAKHYVVKDDISLTNAKSSRYCPGHFRLLSSKRFVNKRGQLVYVKSYFTGKNNKTIKQ